jgi:hypothetical protein
MEFYTIIIIKYSAGTGSGGDDCGNGAELVVVTLITRILMAVIMIFMVLEMIICIHIY